VGAFGGNRQEKYMGGGGGDVENEKKKPQAGKGTVRYQTRRRESGPGKKKRGVI